MSEHSRVSALDSVRGIAALVVVLHHTVLMASAPSPVPGRASVMVFFVLSGYVLTLSLARADQTYTAFALRRVIRIFAPYAVAILVAASMALLIKPKQIPELSPWFNEWWQTPVSSTMVVRHLLMTGRNWDFQLDSVAWSLVYELRISLIFPILCWATRRWPVVVLFASLLLNLACSAALGCGLRCQPFGASSNAETVLMTLYFVPHFVAGIICAQHSSSIKQTIKTVPSAVLALISVVLLAQLKQDWSLFAGSVVIVASAAAGRFDAALLCRPALWLGRISYSLYLTHMIVLLTLGHLLNGKLPIVVIDIVIVVVAMPVAEVFYRLIEKRAIISARRVMAAPALVG